MIALEISKKELKEKGFNTKKELAKQLSLKLKIPLVKKPIKDKKIILIDDIYETGENIQDKAKDLKERGIKEVWAIVVARK